MKKRNNAFARLVGLLLVSATVLTLTVAATGGAGTSSDPLVTLSYLNEKFLPQILSEVDKKTASRDRAGEERDAGLRAEVRRVERKCLRRHGGEFYGRDAESGANSVHGRRLRGDAAHG